MYTWNIWYLIDDSVDSVSQRWGTRKESIKTFCYCSQYNSKLLTIRLINGYTVIVRGSAQIKPNIWDIDLMDKRTAEEV